MRPHDDKVHKGGEDAWCANDTLIAVADGVGGWADKGVDPGLFSKQLCKDIQKLYEANKDKSLKQILCEAVKLNTFTGSSTACLASLHSETGLMKTTNLGDSGYIIFKVEPETLDVTQVFKSKEQQSYFNCPYQCGTNCEPPTKAFDTEHQMETTDLVVMGTDGVFDNLFDEAYKPCLVKGLSKSENGRVWMSDPTAAANCIGQLAYSKSKDKYCDTPFAIGAKKSGRRF